MGFNPDFINCEKDVAFFEFSLQKWQSPSAYNNHNSSVHNDLLALAEWVNQLSIALGYVFSLDNFELYRVDLSQNFKVLNCHPRDVIRCLELHFSRNPESDSKIERTGHMIALRSNWIGKKLYYKGQEFMYVERKKHRYVYSDSYMSGESENSNPLELQPLSSTEIDDLMSMVRFELEFKRAYLKRYNMGKVISILSLVERFESEKAKFLNVPVLARGDLNLLSPLENHLIDCVRVNGYVNAKNMFIDRYSLRSFYRVKRGLSARSIHLEALENIEYRLQGLNIFHNPERLNFQFELAPFLEPYKKVA